MNEDPIENYISLLQDKTGNLDSNVREMQDYLRLFNSLEVSVSLTGENIVALE